jgi:hypothetical protein
MLFVTCPSAADGMHRLCDAKLGSTSSIQLQRSAQWCIRDHRNGSTSGEVLSAAVVYVAEHRTL